MGSNAYLCICVFSKEITALAWGSFAGWQVLYCEVLIRACQFGDNVLCCCPKTSVQKSFLTQIKIERDKVNKKVQRFKVTI